MKTFLMTVSFLFITLSISAHGIPHYVTDLPEDVLRYEITKHLSDMNMRLIESQETVLIEFKVDEHKKVKILDLKGGNGVLQHNIYRGLDGIQLKTSDYALNTPYRIKVNFKTY